MKWTAISAALISVLVLGTAPVSVMGQNFTRRHLDFDLDHFKCYPAATTRFEPIAGVTLIDQFDRALDRKEIVEIFVFLRFCNSAAKEYLNTFTPNEHPEHHLTLYHFNPDPETKPIQGRVVVANQFGRQKLDIESARILAVPTAKVPGEDEPGTPGTPPTDLDHYKCYYATGQAPDPRVVGLFDQFETHTLNHKLGEPVLFCNPVQKTDRAGNTFEIRNREDHLTCYQISVLTEHDNPAWIYNQFFAEGTFMKAHRANILCVPSKKVSFKLGGPEFGTISPGPGGRDDRNQCHPRGGVADCMSDADCEAGGICQNEGPDCICVAPTPR